MFRPGTYDLYANRFVPFSCVIDVYGLDLTGAVLAAQVRLYPNAGGAPLIDLPQVAAGSQGVTLTSAIGGTTLTATFTIAINATTIKNMAAAGFGQPDVFAWDLRVTPASGPAFILLRGQFIVEAGVTQ